MKVLLKFRFGVWLGLVLAGGFLIPGPVHGATTLVPAGAVWKYFADGFDPGTVWRELAYDDSAWASGPAQLGYGDGDEVTVVGFGPDPANKYITTYFRRTFGVTNLGSIASLTVRLLRDDGGIVYLNGVEVFRSNMPGGPINFNSLAIVSTEDSIFYEGQVPPNLLLAGPNIVAVEIHQNSPASSDMSFDLELVATVSGPTNPPPVRPMIMTHPQSQTVLAGQDVTFSVEATGTEPLGYRWRRNGLTLPGATSSTLSLFNVQPTNAGNYSVVVSNVAGMVLSSNAVLQVLTDTNQPLTVTLTSPTNGAVIAAPATILLRATTSAPTGTVAFVEFFSGTNRVGEDFTSPYVAILSNAPPGPYQFTAAVTVADGTTAVSAPVNVTVTDSTNLPPVAPTIITQPQSQTVFAGQNAIFSVQATGTAPLFYQWRRNGVPLAGATSSSLSLVNVQPTNAGTYSVIVSNLVGFAISSNAVLQVLTNTNQPLAVTLTSPSNGAVFIAPATIILRATTTAPTGTVAFIEFFSGTNRIGQDFASPYVAILSNAPPGQYQFTAVVTAVDGTAAVSSLVNVTVLSNTNFPPVPPTIVTQPQNQTVFAGQTTTFSVGATGTLPLTYAWRFNGVLIPGATLPVLTLFNVGLANAGNYSVVVSNPAGSVLSSNAVLQVLTITNPPPTVTLTSPSNGAIFIAPATILLRARTTAQTGSVAFVEFFSGTNGVGQDFTSPYVAILSNAPPGQYQFTAVVTVADGTTAVSAPVNVTVLNPPPTNHPPVAVASVSPQATLFPDQGGVLIISPNNSNALVVLDGSLSSDPDNDPLEYVWFGADGVFAVGVQVTNVLELGNYTFLLNVDDGELSDTDSVSFEVITAGEAVDFIMERLQESSFGGFVRRPLLATLRSAQAEFDDGEFAMGVRRLHAFQMKVQVRIAPVDPALAGELIHAAQVVIDAVHSP